MSETGVMLPFLKWAGGKRWLFDSEFRSSLPPYRRYIEPFLGGGAGFFALQPSTAVLSDVNPELIDLYTVVRDNPQALQTHLAAHQARHCPDYYYAVRQDVPFDDIERAARTLYLNRTCWNGLYRLNREGSFNVPIGTKTAIVLPTDDFIRASMLLGRVELLQSDFEPVVDRATSGDLLFVDPPYTVKHNLNGFVKYNEKVFSWADQVRLRDAIARAAGRGAAIILTNADHASVRELYQGLGSLDAVARASVISGKTSGRTATSELLVRL